MSGWDGTLAYGVGGTYRALCEACIFFSLIMFVMMLEGVIDRVWRCVESDELGVDLDIEGSVPDV